MALIEIASSDRPLANKSADLNVAQSDAPYPARRRRGYRDDGLTARRAVKLRDQRGLQIMRRAAQIGAGLMTHGGNRLGVQDDMRRAAFAKDIPLECQTDAVQVVRPCHPDDIVI